jgi:hypothetical protein
MKPVEAGEEKDKPGMRIVGENNAGMQNLEPSRNLAAQKQYSESGCPGHEPEEPTLIVA